LEFTIECGSFVILTDHKFSIFAKRRQLVVLDADARIVWLVGQRTDQRFAVAPSTMQVLQLQFIPNLCNK